MESILLILPFKTVQSRAKKKSLLNRVQNTTLNFSVTKEFFYRLD